MGQHNCAITWGFSKPCTEGKYIFQKPEQCWRETCEVAVGRLKPWPEPQKNQYLEHKKGRDKTLGGKPLSFG